ncbi:DNA primase [Campylobacter sp. MIT 12-8780]|uniref:toprim domain-containing protein n=1 Tax=unclassified Campylobacter TaxID=2593542 RepID=UPI00115ECB7C|nr:MULTISPECIES: toprim domain-containing protein [unclassified Campylobacter]NDJ27960.1 DNA primase [Campylobacter sp. MIT 19-121]TQR40108.1 DNA primase [Campylobacter sp. MIT 12-8780]
MKYDLETLAHIPIKDVLEALGAVPARNGRNFHCFNVALHKDNDRNASMAVYERTNSCSCFACGISGTPINITKAFFNGDFKQAAEFLHSHFNIPTLDNNIVKQVKVAFTPKITKEKVYMIFDENKEYADIKDLDAYLSLYPRMSEAQKLKLIYTSLYRFSLKTNQKPKESYYLKRGITKLHLVDKIGFLSYNDVKTLEKYLLERFPLEDLIRFKLFSKTRKTFNYAFNIAVVPNFDLYSNMVVGFSFRSVDSSYKGAKEVNISCSDIVYPMPFGLENESLRMSKWIWICEGHIDLLSLRQYYENSDDVCFIAFNGVFAYKEEFLTLLKGKSRIVISFDKDEAGINGEKALREHLNLLRIPNLTARWDCVDGIDLNDLLCAKKLNTLTFDEAI